MDAVWFATGAALSGLGVLLGAFGAHGLRGRVTFETSETGKRIDLLVPAASSLEHIGQPAGVWRLA